MQLDLRQLEHQSENTEQLANAQNSSTMINYYNICSGLPLQLFDVFDHTKPARTVSILQALLEE